MSRPKHFPAAAGMIGLFLVLLGAGLILDAGWVVPGAITIAAGGWCLWAGRRHDARGSRSAA